MSDAAIRPDVRAFLENLSRTPLARLEELGVEGARALSKEIRAARGAADQSGVIVRDVCAPSAWGKIGLRCYEAEGEPASGPMIAYFHGGGFVLGDLDSHHDLCLAMVRALRLPVVSVDYRLAPEHPWPAAPDDAEAAARWIAANALDALGLRATGLVLAGDSAGANLAAVTAHALVARPAAIPLFAQFLIYPCVTPRRATRSLTENGEGFFLTRAAIAWFEANYRAPSDDPRFNLLAFDQSGMPPTLLVTASLDPLRDEGRRYAGTLIEAGVPVIFQEAFGNIHGCFGMIAAIPSSSKDMDRAFEAFRSLISEAAPPRAMARTSAK
ncbi:MAG: alpha/beta hydrolase [Rhizomicrobium sp.]